MNHYYSVQICWSTEDQAYIATIPELEGCMADGQSVEEALQNLKQVASEWVDTAEQLGRSVPSPLSSEDIAVMQSKVQRNIQEQINVLVNEAVMQAVQQVVSKLVPQIISKLKTDEGRGALIQHLGGGTTHVRIPITLEQEEADYP